MTSDTMLAQKIETLETFSFRHDPERIFVSRGDVIAIVRDYEKGAGSASAQAGASLGEPVSVGAAVPNGIRSCAKQGDAKDASPAPASYPDDGNYQGAMADLEDLVRVCLTNRAGLDRFLADNYPKQCGGVDATAHPETDWGPAVGAEIINDRWSPSAKQSVDSKPVEFDAFIESSENTQELADKITKHYESDAPKHNEKAAEDIFPPKRCICHDARRSAKRNCPIHDIKKEDAPAMQRANEAQADAPADIHRESPISIHDRKICIENAPAMQPVDDVTLALHEAFNQFWNVWYGSTKGRMPVDEVAKLIDHCKAVGASLRGTFPEVSQREIPDNERQKIIEILFRFCNDDDEHMLAFEKLKPYLRTQTPATSTEEDVNKCPGCGGIADNGHDRCLPPNPYYCTKCVNSNVETPQSLRLKRKLERSRTSKDGNHD